MNERKNSLGALDQELKNLKEKYPQQFLDAQEVVEEIGRMVGKKYTQGEQLLLNLHLKKFGDEGYNTFAKDLALDSNVGVIFEKYQNAKEEKRAAFLRVYQLIAARFAIIAAATANENINRTN